MKPGFGILVLLILGTLAAGYVGSLFTPGQWYQELAKPAWTPPGWVFGPVWAILYVLMAVAAWLVWRRDGFRRARGPLVLYVFQLVLNGAWSYLFFGLHLVFPAFLEVVLLWLSILATMAAFGRVSRKAAWLLLPYLGWVGFAAVLHFAIWRLQG